MARLVYLAAAAASGWVRPRTTQHLWLQAPLSSPRSKQPKAIIQSNTIKSYQDLSSIPESHQTVARLVYLAAAAASGWVRPRTTQHLWLQAPLSSPRSKQPKAIIQSNTIKSYQDLSSIPESHQTVARLVYLAAAAASGWVRPRTTQHLWLQAPLSSPRSKQPKAIIQSNTIKSYQDLSSIPESHQTVARLVYLAAAAASGWVRPRTTQHLWLQAPLSSPRSKQPKAIIQSNTIKSYPDLSSIPESHQTVARLVYLAAAAASGWVRPRTTQHLWLQAPLSSPRSKQPKAIIQSNTIKSYQDLSSIPESHQTVARLVYLAAAAASGWVRPRTTQHLWLQAPLSSPRSKQPKAIIQSNTIKSYQDLSSIPESHQTVARLVYLAAAAASGWVRPRTTQHLWLQAPLSSPRSKQPKAIIQSKTIKSYPDLSSIQIQSRISSDSDASISLVTALAFR